MKENVARKLQDSGSYDIWRKLGLWTSFSKRLTWCAVVFAFLAGLAGLLKTVEEIAQVANVLSIVLAFLAALAGLAAKLADKRKQALEEAHMRTCPEMEVAIKTSSNSGRFLVVVEPHNNVPFEYDWKIVTRNNLIISGMHLQWGRVDPNPQTPVFTERADFDVSRVVDDYIELRFDYRSIYAHELPNADLSGRLTKAYRLTPDRQYCVPTELQQWPP